MKDRRYIAFLRPPRQAVLGGLALTVLAGLTLAPQLAAPAAGSSTAWRPVASERLIKLPAQYLKKAIDRDFSNSELANAMVDVEDRIKRKRQTLEDLQAAVERAEGEIRTELRHQFLAEKKAYIELAAEQQSLRRRQAKTKIRLYEKLLGKLKREQGALTPQRAALIEKQDAARQRFEAARVQVDTKLFQSTLTAESKYAREYAKNISAIETLVQAINAHPMNASAEIDGQAISKADYLRHLIAEGEADLAIVDQEGAILGFMAKLVSLDALALSEDIDPDAETDLASDEDAPDADHVTSAVGFFVGN